MDSLCWFHAALSNIWFAGQIWPKLSYFTWACKLCRIFSSYFSTLSCTAWSVVSGANLPQLLILPPYREVWNMLSFMAVHRCGSLIKTVAVLFNDSRFIECGKTETCCSNCAHYLRHTTSLWSHKYECFKNVFVLLQSKRNGNKRPLYC